MYLLVQGSFKKQMMVVFYLRAKRKAENVQVDKKENQNRCAVEI